MNIENSSYLGICCDHCSMPRFIITRLYCAIVDLSVEVFSPGMAYIALSRVPSLSGLYIPINI